MAGQHLEVHLTRPDFWRGTVEMLAAHINRFEELAEPFAA